jgi:transcriptional regulator with XRE-family HTH domain
MTTLQHQQTGTQYPPQTPGNERGWWFRAELLKRGLTIRSLARRLGVSPKMISQVLKGFSRSQRIEREVCLVLGLQWEEAFPPLRRRRNS